MPKGISSRSEMIDAINPVTRTTPAPVRYRLLRNAPAITSNIPVSRIVITNDFFRGLICSEIGESLSYCRQVNVFF